MTGHHPEALVRYAGTGIRKNYQELLSKFTMRAPFPTSLDPSLP
jgi:hypothetical protein